MPHDETLESHGVQGITPSSKAYPVDDEDQGKLPVSRENKSLIRKIEIKKVVGARSQAEYCREVSTIGDNQRHLPFLSLLFFDHGTSPPLPCVIA